MQAVLRLSQTTLFGPSMTSALISSPRYAGRQCRTRQPGLASASFAASRRYGSRTTRRAAAMASWPIDTHTSVAITSACSHAAAGSVQSSTVPPVCSAIRAAAATTSGSGTTVPGAADAHPHPGGRPAEQVRL